MASLVKWKKKLDKYDGEYDSDDTDVFQPRLCDTMNEPMFIRRDEANARAMRALKIKW